GGWRSRACRYCARRSLGRYRPGYPAAALDWALAPAPGGEVLDLGAGTGKVTEALLRRPGVRVTAVDPDPAMLAQFRADSPRVARPNAGLPGRAARDVAGAAHGHRGRADVAQVSEAEPKQGEVGTCSVIVSDSPTINGASPPVPITVTEPRPSSSRMRPTSPL